MKSSIALLAFGAAAAQLAHDPPAPLAVPTSAQLRWAADEVSAIGHFNMGTFEACGIGDVRPGHGMDPLAPRGITLPPPETFAPTNVDVEGWLDALQVSDSQSEPQPRHSASPSTPCCVPANR